MATARTCSHCGTMVEVPDDGLPAGWAILTEGGRLQHVCVDCVRRNIRAIEGKLPEEWWE